MRSKHFLITGAILAVLVCAATVAGANDGQLGGGAVQARTAVLSGGIFAPIGNGSNPSAPTLLAGPERINFQGRLTDPDTGNAVADGTYSVTFSVYDDPGAGTQLWTETASVSVNTGLFTHELGSANDLPVGLFDSPPRFLQVQVASDPPMTPRLPFLAVPYAFHADVADLAADASDVNCAGCVHSSDVEDGGLGTADIADNSLESADLQFNYAASTSEGGPATDVACAAAAGCVSGSEVVDGQVASADIADGTITSTDIANTTIVSIDIADGTITNADIAADTILGTNIAGGAVASAEIADGTITGGDVQDGSLTATDVASSANSQLLDSVDSLSFLRSDVSDNYTAGVLTFNSGTTLEMRNAGGTQNIRLSNNGADGNQTICFWEGGVAGACGEFFQWIDNSNFSFSDDVTSTGTVSGASVTATGTVSGATVNSTGDLTASGNLDVNGNLLFGNTEAWRDAGFNTIDTFGNSVFINGGALCVDDNIDGAPVDECDEEGLAAGLAHFELGVETDGGVFANGNGSFNGTVRVDTLGAAGATALCRNVSNQLSTCSSSARYKDDITALAFDGEKLLALRPVEFNWKENGEPGVGLVAEEVAEVLPELVTYNDKGEVEGVNYDGLTVYLLEQLKQHEAELAELRGANADNASPDATPASADVGAMTIALLLAAAVGAAAVMSATVTLLITRTPWAGKKEQRA